MSSQNGKNSPDGSWGSGSQSPPDLDELLRQAKNQFKQLLPGSGPRGILLPVLLVLIILGAWTAYYTIPSDSVAVVQRFGKYLKEVPA